MNIILTSAGLKTATIQKEILRLLPKPPNELKIAHIITAAQVASDRTFVDKDRDAMRQLGFCVIDMLLEDLDANSTLQTLQSFDIIYVQGGNGFYLLGHAQRCNLEAAVREILQDENKWYIGVSAGSYIACPTIEMHNWKAQKDQYGVANMTAMGLVPFLVVVHYNREKYREKLAENIPNASHPVRILTDNQAFVIIDDDIQLIGEGQEVTAASILDE
jgi:dipeptidase E